MHRDGIYYYDKNYQEVTPTYKVEENREKDSKQQLHNANMELQLYSIARQQYNPAKKVFISQSLWQTHQLKKPPHPKTPTHTPNHDCMFKEQKNEHCTGITTHILYIYLFYILMNCPVNITYMEQYEEIYQPRIVILKGKMCRYNNNQVNKD